MHNPLRRLLGLAVLVTLLVISGVAVMRLTHPLRPVVIEPYDDLATLLTPSIPRRVDRLARELSAAQGATRPKLIALTFDDGPYPVTTPLLLHTLSKLGIHATFFAIGRDALAWPGITKRIEESGNEIADHTATHPDLDAETSAQVTAEVLGGRDELWSMVHDPAIRTLMRPPHGRYTVQTIRTVQRLGYTVVLWSDDTGDWRDLLPANIVAHMMARATAPEIELLHSGKLATVQALPEVVARFRAAGYRFVTVSQLLEMATRNQIEYPARHAV